MLSLDLIREKKYEELTKDELEFLLYVGILNGYGWAGQSWIVRKLIGWIMEDFIDAIPYKHDFWYWQGWNEARRKECDEKFYQAMLDDIRRLYDEGKIGKWGLVWKSVVALMAWSAIRNQWYKYFKYTVYP